MSYFLPDKYLLSNVAYSNTDYFLFYFIRHYLYKTYQIVKKGNTSGTIPRKYTAWLDTCFSVEVTYCTGMRKLVDIWDLSLRIIHVQAKI